jgi:hypothetical protein
MQGLNSNRLRIEADTLELAIKHVEIYHLVAQAKFLGRQYLSPDP